MTSHNLKSRVINQTFVCTYKHLILNVELFRARRYLLVIASDHRAHFNASFSSVLGTLDKQLVGRLKTRSNTYCIVMTKFVYVFETFSLFFNV